jgi:excisionase family DNA binding protein
MEKVLTTSEAVRQFGMHPATVLRLILTQRVAAHKDANGKWLVRRSDLERWNRQRVRRGPKRVQAALGAHQ